ncbi:MAG: inositol-3-phosphate synthase [Rhodospirillales bacterium]|nr:inositol-3-phosphate synthase [Rhodospirillales bacterium]
MSEQTSFYPELQRKIAEPSGTLGVLLPGMGAVATTLMAGVYLINKGLAKPVGSLTQMRRIRLGKRSDPRFALIKDVVPLANLTDLRFGGWDIYPATAYESAVNAGVVPPDLLAQVRDELAEIGPWPAVFDRAYVRNLDGSHVKTGLATKMDMAEALMRDIESFRQRSGVSRTVMIWCGSTEIHSQPVAVHETIETFERGLKDNAPEISPSMIYAYAAIQSGVAFANGAPQLMVDIPALQQLAADRGVPIAGKDFKTGQTLLKTIVAPGLKARMLGLDGWFSTNILGNRDGEVLDDADSFRSKELSKGGVLDSILQPALYPDLPRCITRSASNTTRRAATPRKAGTTSTSSAGWDSRCRSRSISCVAIRFWQRRSYSTSSCCSTWRNGPRCPVFRNGCRSISNHR